MLAVPSKAGPAILACIARESIRVDETERIVARRQRVPLISLVNLLFESEGLVLEAIDTAREDWTCIIERAPGSFGNTENGTKASADNGTNGAADELEGELKTDAAQEVNRAANLAQSDAEHAVRLRSHVERGGAGSTRGKRGAHLCGMMRTHVNEPIEGLRAALDRPRAEGELERLAHHVIAGVGFADE
tara:strand:+ start:2131 stop:2700 length:570 start_codon:yes stop_codon:yes gene_type:complete